MEEECANCNHTWRFHEAGGTRFCTPVCQVFFYVLGKKRSPQFNDVMVVRDPRIELLWGAEQVKGLSKSEKDYNNTDKRRVTAHWRSIYLEFVEYFDDFVAPRMEAAGLGRFQASGTEEKPADQTQKGLTVRALRKLLDGLANEPALRALVETREQADTEFRPNGTLALLGRGNQDQMREAQYGQMEGAMRRLRDATVALDQALAGRIADYSVARDNFLMLMQADDYGRRIGHKAYMSPWRADIDKHSRELTRRPSDRNRHLLKNRLMLAFTLYPYYKKLQFALTKDKSLRTAVETMHSTLLDMLDSQQADGYAEVLQRTVLTLKEEARKHRKDYAAQRKLEAEVKAKKKGGSSGGDESRSTKDKGKSSKSKSGKVKIKKAKRPDTKGDNSMEVEQPTTTTTTTNNHNGNLPMTADEAMQVQEPLYRPDEIAARVEVAQQMADMMQTQPADSERRLIVENMRDYFIQIRDKGTPY